MHLLLQLLKGANHVGKGPRLKLLHWGRGRGLLLRLCHGRGLLHEG